MRFDRRETVEFFFSFRSPYSYLAAPRVFELSSRFHVSVQLRCMAPMVERGMSLPRSKALYIVRDCRREAKRLRMPFGPMWDPIGDGARRCCMIAEKAARADAHEEFVLRASRAIWSKAADVSRDDVLEQLCVDSGLDWNEMREALGDEQLALRLDENRARLEAVGHWGVPTLVFRGEPFWGQDRIVDAELALAGAGLATPLGHLAARSRR